MGFLFKEHRYLPFSERCAQASAHLRAKLKIKGLLIGPYDLLIAGTALEHQMTIVTSNVLEFRRLPEIAIEDWLVS